MSDLILTSKAAAIRAHVIAQGTPLNVDSALADFQRMYAGTAFGGMEKSHYTFYVRNMNVETTRSRGVVSGAQVQELTEEEPLATLRIVRMEDEENNFDPKILIPLRTNTAFDQVVSKRGGAMRGTVNMITGESGAGKTTVSANIATYIKQNNPGATAGMLQGEMNRLDWFEECVDNKMLAKLDVVFLLEILDAPNFVELIEQACSTWDFGIIDSFEVVLEQIREVKGWTTKKAEKTLIEMLNRVAERGVCLFVIQHYTKGGTYAGSTKIKHLTTAMIFVMFDKNGERYVIFTKNRRCGHMVNKRLYFTKNRETGQLEFDGQRFQNEEAVSAHVRTERDALNSEQSIFNDLLAMAAANSSSGLTPEEQADAEQAAAARAANLFQDDEEHGTVVNFQMGVAA